MAAPGERASARTGPASHTKSAAPFVTRSSGRCAAVSLKQGLMWSFFQRHREDREKVVKCAQATGKRVYYLLAIQDQD